jgi:methylated-DNA-[protein]-cysteine S-methyltransferase
VPTYDLIESPIGWLFIGCEGDALAHIEHLAAPEDAARYIERVERETGATPERGGTAVAEVVRQLGEYFAGERRTFDLALAPHGTDWQLRVWMALRDIPYGETVNYGTIAARLGHPTASRAVGAANGRNPISIVVPCHRVIGANQSLTGYGGGLPRKHWLLAREGVRLALDAPDAALVQA